MIDVLVIVHQLRVVTRDIKRAIGAATVYDMKFRTPPSDTLQASINVQPLVIGQHHNGDRNALLVHGFRNKSQIWLGHLREDSLQSSMRRG